MLKRLGTPKVGTFADIIAMHASFLADINELLDVDLVIKLEGSGQV